MIHAHDVMTPRPTSINAEMPILEAVDFFLKQFVSSVPVVTSDGATLGQLSDLNLMRAFVQAKAGVSSALKIIDFKNLLNEPQIVTTQTPLPEVVAALIRCPLHRVLVVDGAGHLVGIISPKDVLRALRGGKGSGLVSKMHDLEENVEELTAHLKQTSDKLETYKTLTEASPFMLHSVDRDGVILMANPALHRFLQYSPGELVGRSVFDIYPATLHEAVRSSLSQLADHGPGKLVYSSYLTKVGAMERVEILSSSVHDEHGNFVGTMTLSRPIDSDQLLRMLHGVLDKK